MMIGDGNQCELLYRGSRDGFCSKDLHSKCDQKGPTLTLIKSKPYGRVFGAYTNIHQSTKGNAKKNNGSTFLFSYRESENKLVKLDHVKGPEVVHRGNLFETAGADLQIMKNGDRSAICTSELGNNFATPPGFTSSDEELKTYLAGAKKFSIQDIEVFAVKS